MRRAFYRRGLTNRLMKVPTFSRHYFRLLLDRLGARIRESRALRALRVRRKAIPFTTPTYLQFPAPYAASIHRDVTPNGVRVYSLCNDCGSRLNASATLCEDCAQKRSRPARPR